jgi:hypothetical protein
MKTYLILILLIFKFGYSQTYNYYFGNLHSHTGFSDGNKDSLTSGVSQPSGAYNYAKLSQNFDFLGVSEHNHYSSNNNPGFKKQSYAIGLSQATAANSSGTFVSVFGMEWGVSSNYNGHVVVYGFNQLIGWEPTVSGVSGNNYDIFNAKNDYAGLFSKVKNNPNAFCFLAHPYYTDFCQNMVPATAILNSPYNAMYDSAIVGTPLRSGLAFSTFDDYSNYPVGNYFDYFKRLLALGYHVGIGYDHDNHYTNYGRSNGGRLAVVMQNTLNTTTLFNAIKQMNFYGTDDSNAKVNFSCAGNIMGAILTLSNNPTFNVTHNDGDGEMADSIKIWRGTINTTTTLAAPINFVTNNNTLAFTDNTLLSNTDYYYFAEIKQADGQWIVTSPIWINKTTPTNLQTEIKNIELTMFPNPANTKLFLSFGECNDYKIEIFNLMGQLILTQSIFGNETTLNISNLNKGVYLVQISNGLTQNKQKLIVE